jgi:hypothetical protein
VVDERAVHGWFQAYLVDFVALARGDSDDRRRLLAHYGLPLLLSTDAGSTALTGEQQLLGAVGQQIDGMRAAGYDRSEELSAVTTVVNRSCALHRAAFARLRVDGTEIGRIDTTYVIADLSVGRRITGLLVHSAP